MSKMKTTNKYYFSVEGETEKWYLDWLQGKINSQTEAVHRVSFDSKIEKNPLKRVKSMNIISKVAITHIFDYESNDQEHATQFISTLDLLKETSKLGKEIKYNLGYTNFAFELWMVLHKVECNAPFLHRRQYLTPINRAYNENFEKLDHYKQEQNFKRLLEKLDLNDVKKAIERSKVIMKRNEDNGLIIQKYKGYQYFRENPSLSIWESIEKIMKDCRLM